MTRPALALALAAATLVPCSAIAQPRGDRPAWAGERREVMQDVRSARDDRRDLKRVEQLLSDYDRAVRDRDTRGMGQLEERAQQILRDEWAEGQAELERARVEAARKEQELRGDRREVMKEQRERDGAGAADARREFREDKRELMDDRRDAAAEARALERVRQIGDQLWSLRGRYRKSDVAHKRDLIAEMVQMARAELREDRRELREDRGDRREDRHDRR